MKNIDLHLHSTASDGTYTPSELVESAEKLNLAAIALTDHDTLAGLQELLKRGENSPVTTIPGVEVAVDWHYRELHILGYWIDQDCRILNDLLKNIRANRDKRNCDIVRKLNKNGYRITIDDITKEARGESIGRPHIASALVKKGYFKTVTDVFSACLARGGNSYVPRILPLPKEAIDAIHEAGGIAFWAHSVHRSKNEYKNLKSDIIEFINMGLDGIEAYYTEFSPKQQQKLLKYANELGIPVSGGSDFHGTNQPGIFMGSGKGNLNIPEQVFENLSQYFCSLSG